VSKFFLQPLIIFGGESPGQISRPRREILGKDQFGLQSIMDCFNDNYLNSFGYRATSGGRPN
jgi:hypothetical protein